MGMINDQVARPDEFESVVLSPEKTAAWYGSPSARAGEFSQVLIGSSCRSKRNDFVRQPLGRDDVSHAADDSHANLFEQSVVVEARLADNQANARASSDCKTSRTGEPSTTILTPEV